MKFKVPVIIIVVANLLIVVGAWMKITHQPAADLTLTISLIGEAVGILWLIVTAFKKDLPNRL